MAEKPILFSGEMVKAILDGRKTQTRRVIKPQPNIPDANWKFPAWADVPLSPYGRPGDCLWVRETWQAEPGPEYDFGDWVEDVPRQFRNSPDVYMHTYYRADTSQYNVIHYGEEWGRDLTPTGQDITELSKYDTLKWRPSIHMPRWASRLTLRVIDVKVQRLWDISEHDMNKEGVASPPEDEPIHWVTPWIKLWDGINGKRGYPWADNPFVWVVEFEVSK